MATHTLPNLAAGAHLLIQHPRLASHDPHGQDRILRGHYNRDTIVDQ